MEIAILKVEENSFPEENWKYFAQGTSFVENISRVKDRDHDIDLVSVVDIGVGHDVVVALSIDVKLVVL